MYPILKGAVKFYMDWLVKNPKTKELVSGSAVSLENSFIVPDGRAVVSSVWNLLMNNKPSGSYLTILSWFLASY